MPPMRPCRSHNHFTPSTALWQHFVLPARPSFSARRQSSASAPVQEPDNGSEILSTDTLAGDVPHDGNGASETIVLNKLIHKYDPIQKYGTSRKPSLPGPRSVKPNLRLERLKWINDYKGVSVLPLLAPKKPKETEVPWHISMREREGKDQNEILSQEICSFHDYIRPSPLETVARKTTVKRVKNSVRAVLPDMDLEVFGSERTGLAFALSDLDLRLVADDEQTATGLPSRNVRNRLNGHLKTLERELRKQTTSYSLVAHRHARYPLVAMQHRSTGLDVQIVLSNDTAQSRDYMNRSMKEFPYLSQLYSVVKTMFDMRGLSDVFRGGFGSYSIFMMIVASLRHSPSIPSDVGQALLHFLEFWERFDTTSKGISIEPAELYDKASTQVISRTAKIKLEENKTQPPNFMLSLRDPADPTNDLGRKGFCIKHVQATCAFLLLDLRQRLEKQHTESFLASIVACIYPLQLASRRRLEAIGLTVERSRLPVPILKHDYKSPTVTAEQAVADEQIFQTRLSVLVANTENGLPLATTIEGLFNSDLRNGYKHNRAVHERTRLNKEKRARRQQQKAQREKATAPLKEEVAQVEEEGTRAKLEEEDTASSSAPLSVNKE